MIPAFERAKKFHALDRAATLSGLRYYSDKLCSINTAKQLILSKHVKAKFLFIPTKLITYDGLLIIYVLIVATVQDVS
jgi:hypothetical protein